MALSHTFLCEQTGCLGCASGKDSAPKNIFGNKYGQNLAAVQIAREKRMAAMKKQREQEQQKAKEEEQQQQQKHPGNAQDDVDGGYGDSETDESDDDEDYGPTPAAGVWAGSKRLMAESEALADAASADGGDEEDNRSTKRARR